MSPLEKDVIAPGDSAALEIIFSTGTYRGRVTKSPVITTNEALTRAIHFVRISCEVVLTPDSTYPFVIEPYRWNLSQVGGVSTDSISFSMQNLSGENLAPGVVDFPDDLLVIDLPGSVPAGGSGFGFVCLTPEAESLEFEKSVTIAFNDLLGSRFTVPVTRTIQ